MEFPEVPLSDVFVKHKSHVVEIHVRAAGAAALTSLKGLVEEQNQEVSKCSMRIGELVGSLNCFSVQYKKICILQRCCYTATLQSCSIILKHASVSIPASDTSSTPQCCIAVSHYSSLTSCMLCSQSWMTETVKVSGAVPPWLNSEAS